MHIFRAVRVFGQKLLNIQNTIVLQRYPIVFSHCDVTAGGLMAQLSQIFACDPTLW